MDWEPRLGFAMHTGILTASSFVLPASQAAFVKCEFFEIRKKYKNQTHQSLSFMLFSRIQCVCQVSWASCGVLPQTASWLSVLCCLRTISHYYKAHYKQAQISCAWGTPNDARRVSYYSEWLPSGSFQLGFSPVAWNNQCPPGKGHSSADVSYEKVVRQTVKIWEGFGWVFRFYPPVGVRWTGSAPCKTEGKGRLSEKRGEVDSPDFFVKRVCTSWIERVADELGMTQLSWEPLLRGLT